MKISQYLAKIWTRVVSPFLTHGVHSQYQKLQIHSVERGICPIAKSNKLQLVISKNATACGNFGHSSINKHYIAQFS